MNKLKNIDEIKQMNKLEFMKCNALSYYFYYLMTRQKYFRIKAWHLAMEYKRYKKFVNEKTREIKAA